MIFTPSFEIDILLISLMFIIMAHSGILVSRGSWIIFDPLNFFWVGVFVIYISQPITYYESLISWYGESVIEETLFWIVFGVIFLIIGYEAKWGRRWGLKIPNMPQKLSPKGVQIVAFILIIAGLVGWKDIFDTAGGLRSWAAVSRGGTDWENLSGYTTALSKLTKVGVGLLVLCVEMYPVKKILRFLAWMLLVVMLFWMLYLGSRSRVIFVVLTALLAWYLPRRKNPPLLLLFSIFITLLIVTSFQAEYRNNFTNFSFNLDRINWSVASERVLPRFLTDSPARRGARGLEFSGTAAVVDLVPEHVEYNYGYSELELFTRAIPRRWWAKKRYPHFEAFTPIYQKGHLSDHWVEYVYRPFLGGPSFGYIGHWFAVGGPLMLAFAGLFTGGLLKAIRTIYDRSNGNEGNLILYMILVPIGFNDVTGVPLWWIFTLPLILVPLLTLVYLTKKKTKFLLKLT